MRDGRLSSDVPSLALAIGEWALGLRSDDRVFIDQLKRHYADFLCPPGLAQHWFDIEIVPGGPAPEEIDVEVRRERRGWVMRRGDFTAQWNPAERCGRIVQSANPYSTDSVIRIVHSLRLAECGGFLAHAASAIHRGRALLFSGISGTGKTTLTQLAPPGTIRLTDEISYVRRCGADFFASGTPFTGELNTPGANRTAPLAALYFLKHAGQHRITPLTPAIAARQLMRNILYFVDEPAPTRQLFDAIIEFVSTIPAFELAFAPQASVWSLL